MDSLRRAEATASKPGGLAEVAMTLPVFLVYQFGVVFLHVRNGADVVTSRLLEWAHGDRVTYLELTAAIGLVAFVLFGLFGGRRALRVRSLVQIAAEGALYAVAMSAGTAWIVGKLFAGPHASAMTGALPGLVMSMGAGFYEELAFRAVLFGLGAKLLTKIFVRRPSSSAAATAIAVPWALVSAAVFSGMHYVGALGEPFDPRSFVARAVLGMALTSIYAFRGFATAVWTHALYDTWVLVF